MSSEPLTGRETTSATNMTVYDETSTTMRVSWEEANGATGYILLYKPINSSEPQPVGEVHAGGDVTNVLLENLIPNTAYAFRLYVLRREDAIQRLEGTGVTRA
ncbi:collagen alpha-1(XII) chain isoform X6 [Xyrichtys novacula]|uniref:Collagen alpha-1(XII) chain isoform X6 n=1 Tax=Xyrichtys novacula TaxID=13765 RepID=A0AAV1HS63_XYRNO|nr:collagen alpha-1(XII) chain isoform X6 [Xyrichtys novacula]